MNLLSNLLWTLRTGSQNKSCSPVITALWDTFAGINRVWKPQTLNRTACPMYILTPGLFYPPGSFYPPLPCLYLVSEGLSLHLPSVFLLAHSRNPDNLIGTAFASKFRLRADCPVSHSHYYLPPLSLPWHLQQSDLPQNETFFFSVTTMALKLLSKPERSQHIWKPLYRHILHSLQ